MASPHTQLIPGFLFLLCWCLIIQKEFLWWACFWNIYLSAAGAQIIFALGRKLVTRWKTVRWAFNGFLLFGDENRRYHNHFNHQKKSFTLLSDENHYQHEDNGLPFANIEKQSITSISITERNKNHQKEQKPLPCNDSCGTIVDSYGTDGLAVIVCYL